MSSRVVGGEYKTVALLVVGVETRSTIGFAFNGCRKGENVVATYEIYDALVDHTLSYLVEARNLQRVVELALQLHYNACSHALEPLTIVLGDRLGRLLRYR